MGKEGRKKKGKGRKEEGRRKKGKVKGIEEVVRITRKISL